MYSDVVMEKAEGIEPYEGKGIRVQLDTVLGKFKEKQGYVNDTELTGADLKYLCEEYKKMVTKALGKPFPDDPMEQL